MRKERILAVAFEEFAQSGYHTTLSQIARRAGIKKQTIYNYFDNKDDLLFEVISIEIKTFYEEKTRELNQLKDLDTKEALKTIFFSICEYYKDIHKLRFWRWLLLIKSTELFGRFRDLIRESEREFYISIKEIVEKGMKTSTTDPKCILAAVQVFATSIQGILDGMLLYRDIYDPQILIENVWNFYWRSIEAYIKD